MITSSQATHVIATLEAPSSSNKASGRNSLTSLLEI